MRVVAAPGVRPVQAIARAFAGGAMDTYVVDLVEPLLSLLLEVGVVEERPAVDEVVAQIAARTLDFPLGLPRYGRQARGVKLQ